MMFTRGLFSSQLPRTLRGRVPFSSGPPTVITVAITGDVADKARCCDVPLSPEEQIVSIKEAYEAGARMCHLHVRDTDNRCTWFPEQYEKVVEGVNRVCPEMIMQFSTGNYAPSNQARAACLQLQPEMASLTPGSVNFRFTRPGQSLDAARAFINGHRDIEFLADAMQTLGVKPDIAIFDLSMIYSAAQLFERKLISPPFRFMFVLGGHMALPAEKEILQFLLAETTRVFAGQPFSWCGVGVGWNHTRVCQWTLELGGHPRTGFEDSLMIRRGHFAKSNADLVRHVVELTKAAGRSIASPAEARQLLGLPEQRLPLPENRPHSSQFVSTDAASDSSLFLSLAASNRKVADVIQVHPQQASETSTSKPLNRIVIVRHGDRFDYTQGESWAQICQKSGQQPRNTPLSSIGERQSEATATRLVQLLAGHTEDNQIELFSSPYLRAIQTALPLAKSLKLPLNVEPALAEGEHDLLWSCPSSCPSESLTSGTRPFPHTDWLDALSPTVRAHLDCFTEKAYTPLMRFEAAPRGDTALIKIPEQTPLEISMADTLTRMLRATYLIEQEHFSKPGESAKTLVMFSHASPVSALVSALLRNDELTAIPKAAPAGIWVLQRPVGSPPNMPWVLVTSSCTQHLNTIQGGTKPWGFKEEFNKHWRVMASVTQQQAEVQSAKIRQANSIKQIWQTHCQGLLKEFDVKLVEVANDLRAVQVSMNLATRFEGFPGRVHGGVICSLADSAATAAAFLNKPDGTSGVSVSSANTTFLRPVLTSKVSAIHARACLVKKGRGQQVWDVEVTSGKSKDELFAVVRLTIVYSSPSIPKGVCPEHKQPTSKPPLETANWWNTVQTSTLGQNFNAKEMDKAEITQKFDTYAPIWEDLTVKGGYFSPTERIGVFSWLHERVSQLRDLAVPVLDLACGTGLVGRTLREAGVTGPITGVDISEGMLAQATITGCYDRVFVRDLEEPLEFSCVPAAGFGIITCCGAIELLRNPQGLLTNAKGLLNKKNGQLLFTFQQVADPCPTSHQNLTSFTLREVIKAFQQAGLDVVDCQSLPQAYWTPQPDKTLAPVPYWLITAVVS